jgi:hypothetical protein
MSHTESLKKQAAALQAKMEAQAAKQKAKMEAQAAKQKAKLDAINDRIRRAEETDAAIQRYREQQMAEEVKAVIQRYQKKGLRADYQLVKGPFLGTEAVVAAGLRVAPVLVDAKAAEAAAAPKRKTDWQKWCTEHVQPILKTCDRYYDTNLFSVARHLRLGDHMTRVLYAGGVLEKATVEEAVAAMHADAVKERDESYARLWGAAAPAGAGGAV